MKELSTDDITKLRSISTLESNRLENNLEMVLALRVVEYKNGKLYWIEGTDPNYWLYEQ